jgi:thermitase
MKRSILKLLLFILLLLVPATTLAQSAPTPNDPAFEEEWALRHIGAPCAWQHTTGSSDVTVAIVDSGVDMQHPDLVDRLRQDGRDFVDGDDDPSDENGHGTNVAGIIAATLDNNAGIVGLAPGVMILPVRVMNAQGYGSDRAIARGIRYAADQGARVINLSLGATLMVGADTASAQVSDAIRYAQDRGALVVVAAGNDFVPLPNAIVGDNPDVLVVAATDDADRKADFSNSGPWVSVTAPGVHILSTMPTYEVYLTSEAVPRDERFRQNYDYMSGTSSRRWRRCCFRSTPTGTRARSRRRSRITRPTFRNRTRAWRPEAGWAAAGSTPARRWAGRSRRCRPKRLLLLRARSAPTR